MSARRSAGGNGDNTLSYTCNVRARTRAHARVMGVRPAVASVATVANDRDWLTNAQDETVAQTVATNTTVATGKSADLVTNTVAGLLADAIRVQHRAACRGAPRHQLQALQQEICRLRTLLVGIFAERNGWRHSRAWFTPSMLTGGQVAHKPWRGKTDWSGEFFDHSYCFRTPNRRAAAFATNPYGLHWTADHPSIRAFCERYGLRATIPTDFPSWWLPGRTTLIVLTPLPVASQHATWAQGAARAPPQWPPANQAGDDGQLRQEPSRRRPGHDNPDQEIIMAIKTLTPPAAMASPAAEKLPSSDPGTILALDLATSTGWALRSTNGQIISGTVSFRPSRYDGGGMRYLRFRSWLDSMADDVAEISAVYFEEVRRHVGTDAAHLFGGWLATLSAWCEQHRIPYQGVAVGTIKRHITGKGNADKQAIIAAVRERGFNPADDNEADAIAILLWAIDTHGGVR